MRLGDLNAVPLPFDLPALSRGFAALTPAARATGARAAEAAARALAPLLGREIAIRARPAPGAAGTRAATARLAVDLTAVPAAGLLEVDPALVVALVDLLAGGAGAVPGATAITPIEAAVLELLALAAVDAACTLPEIEDALAPRVSRGAAEPRSALAVELEITAGPVTGNARLLLPASAVRAIAGSLSEGPALAARVPASFRSGRAPLSPDELAALSAGDVVLLDPAEDFPDALVLHAGARFRGRYDGETFHVTEITMHERNAQLPVTLEVELARVDVPLSEIARLEPGAALPLSIDRRGLVTLRVGDRAVARGELVDVDGSVGVRILSVEVAP